MINRIVVFDKQHMLRQTFETNVFELVGETSSGRVIEVDTLPSSMNSKQYNPFSR